LENSIKVKSALDTRDKAENADVCYENGVGFLKEGNYENAVKEFDKAIELGCENTDVWLKKADALHRLGKEAEAKKCKETLVKKLIREVASLRAEGKNEDALKIIDTILSLEPTNIDALNSKAETLSALGRHKEAAIWYENAIKSSIETMEQLRVSYGPGYVEVLDGKVENVKEYDANAEVTEKIDEIKDEIEKECKLKEKIEETKEIEEKKEVEETKPSGIETKPEEISESKLLIDKEEQIQESVCVEDKEIEIIETEKTKEKEREIGTIEMSKENKKIRKEDEVYERKEHVGKRTRKVGLTNGNGFINGTKDVKKRTIKIGLTNGNGFINGNGYTNGSKVGQHIRKKSLINENVRKGIVVFILLFLILFPFAYINITNLTMKEPKIDGDFSDWADVEKYKDPKSDCLRDSDINIIEYASMEAKDSVNYYVKVDGLGQFSKSKEGASMFALLMDNEDGGYAAYGINADHRVIVTTYDRGYSASFESYNKERPGDWNGWVYRGLIPIRISGNSIEFSVPNTLVKATNENRAIIVSVDSENNTDVTDYIFCPGKSKKLLRIEQSPLLESISIGEVSVMKISVSSNTGGSISSLIFSRLGNFSYTDVEKVFVYSESGDKLGEGIISGENGVVEFAEPIKIGNKMIKSNLIVKAKFVGLSGGTFGLKLQSAESVISDGIVTLVDVKSEDNLGNWLGYVGSPPSRIVIDGAFDDWAYVRKYSDEIGDNPNSYANACDITEYAAHNDSERISFYVATDGGLLKGASIPIRVVKPSIIPTGSQPSVPESAVGLDVCYVFLDIDCNANTGYRIDGTIMGAELVIAVYGKDERIVNSECLRYNHSSGKAWNWTFLSKAESAIGNGKLEMQIEYSSSRMNALIVMYGWNGEKGDMTDSILTSYGDRKRFYESKDIDMENFGGSGSRTGSNGWTQWTQSGLLGDSIYEIVSCNIDHNESNEFALISSVGYVLMVTKSGNNRMHVPAVWEVYLGSGYGGYQGVCVGDSDCDGKEEVICADWDKNVSVFEYLGSGEVSSSNPSTTPTWKRDVTLDNLDDPDAVVCGDQDNDGKREIIVGFGYDIRYGLGIYETTGDNAYSLVYAHRVSGNYQIKAVVVSNNADGDSYREIAWGGTDGVIHINESIGDNQYVSRYTYSVGNYINGMCFIDIDIDRDDELFTACGDKNLYCTYSTGPDTYTTSIVYTSKNALTKVKVLALSGTSADGDSQREVFVSRATAGTGNDKNAEVIMVERTGTGWTSASFTPTVIYTADTQGQTIYSICPFYYNSTTFDGDLYIDIIIGHAYVSSTVSEIYIIECSIAVPEFSDITIVLICVPAIIISVRFWKRKV
ncbi:MAG: tetratricopeptide repeat protein, partial [Thermoplasmata archaeon]